MATSSKSRNKKKKNRSRNSVANTGGGYTPRRDWSKIAFYIFSVVIVLSMVCALFASIFPYA